MIKFGTYIKSLREAKQFTLRDVENAIGVSNAYLSQLESEKIKQPSPIVIHKLANLYGVAYDILMESVGYPVNNIELHQSSQRTLSKRFGDVSDDEEIALLEYLAFIRRKKNKK